MKVWTVQNEDEFHGIPVETWKCSDGEWAYMRGTMIVSRGNDGRSLGPHFLAETMTTGFATEIDALLAANEDCYRDAQDSACDPGYLEVPE